MMELFWIFARIGLFTIGGGYAMIPLMEDQCVAKRNWMTHEDMMDMTVIAESTPGPIAINVATMVGFRRGGLPGAVAATLGVVLPSFVIIYLISMFLDHFLEIPVVASAFRGIRIGVGLLIFNAGWNMLKKMKKKPLNVTILAVSCAVMLCVNFFSLNFSSALLLALAGGVSLAVFALRRGEGT